MTDTILSPITFKAGILKDTTELMAEGYWVDGDKIRFRNGRPEKIGGWVSETVEQFEDPTVTTFTGVPRKTLSWNDLGFSRFLLTGTHQKLELFNNNKVHDITPVRQENTLTDAITTASGDSEVTIEGVNHNLDVDDFVYVNSQASAVDGITLSGSYQVTEVIDLDNFKIDSGTNASGTTSGGGGALDIDYLLENGAVSNGSFSGWGGGTWNTPGVSNGGWGRPRTGTDGGLKLRQWSMDTWGEDAVACVRDGSIYHWDRTNGISTRAQILSNAPVQNSFILVAQPIRHLVAFGSEVEATGVFDPLIIRWPEQETLNNWAITDTNTAGEYRLPQGNFIAGAIQTKHEILVFTDTTLYSMRYIGGNNVFQVEPVGTNITVLSQNSFVEVNNTVYWQGKDNFYYYNGSVNILPTSLDKYIFDQDGEGRVNTTQEEKAFAGINKEFNEIFFFYPRHDREENSHYIKYNYIENVSDHGSMERTAWEDRGLFSKPYAFNSEGRLYIHETGKDDDGTPMDAFIRSSYFDIEEGEDLLFIDRILPDIRLPDNKNIEITAFFKKYPHPRSRIIEKGPFFFDNAKNKISMRGRGRQMSIQYKVTATGGDFEIGKMRIGIQPDGER